MSDDIARLRSVFAGAVAIAGADARVAYLDRECGDDANLRQRVDALLEAHAGADSFWKLPADGDGGVSTGPLSELPGTSIGRFMLLEQIGEGGFGVVFRAEQESPMRRQVALKIIKLGMDTRQVVARFDAERQALALMDHLNVAKVFDGGATETGRPYFVMELVQGIPITEYCDQQRLGVRERLELFDQVCQAVQHAHQKGLIHRDIKPTNVLVTVQENQPVVKVIDFGVAKAMEGRLTEKTLFTEFQQLVGTPSYMSPEQAGGAVDVDTRSDVYSLGVLLYELLTGAPPFDAKELRSKAFAEMQRIICEVEPPTPSSKLQTHSGSLPSVAAQRGAEPRKLVATLEGELDWIVMRSLEKERARRYQTAAGLAEDLHRYLHDQPVDARPATRAYKFKKFVQRNSVGVIAGVAIASALMAATVFSTWQALRARRAEVAAVAEMQRADQEAMTAKRITESFQQMLGLIDPDAASRAMMSVSAVRLQVLLGLVRADTLKGPDYTMVQLIDDFAENLEGKLADQPAAAADLHAMIGRAYAARGETEKGRKHLQRGLKLARDVWGEKHDKYAEILVDQARPDATFPNEYLERESDIRRALEIYRDCNVSGERLIRLYITLIWNLEMQGYSGSPERFDEVEGVAIEALAETKKFPEVVFDKTPSLIGTLAMVRIRKGEFAEAEPFARESLDMHLKLHPNSLLTAAGYTNLADAIRPQGKFAESLAAEVQALVMVRGALPSEHPRIAIVSNALRSTLVGAEEAGELSEIFDNAEELQRLELPFREILESTQPTTFTEDDPCIAAISAAIQIVKCNRTLGRNWVEAGKAQEAATADRQADELLEFLRLQLRRFKPSTASRATIEKLQTELDALNQTASAAAG